MNETIIYASLISAFIAGMIALFAPCCVTYLLPAYLGNIFRERKKVLLMTFVFSLGIFIVLLPAVLGVQALSTFVFRYHDQIYLTGGSLMLLFGILAFLGVKLPMPRLSQPNLERPDFASIFTLGVVSGITSACCAPVLAGVLTLSFLAPSFWLAILICAFYFLVMGTLVIYLTLATDFSMAESAQKLTALVSQLQQTMGQIPYINVLFGAAVLAIFGFLWYQTFRGKNDR